MSIRGWRAEPRTRSPFRQWTRPETRRTWARPSGTQPPRWHAAAHRRHRHRRRRLRRHLRHHRHRRHRRPASGFGFSECKQYGPFEPCGPSGTSSFGLHDHYSWSGNREQDLYARSCDSCKQRHDPQLSVERSTSDFRAFYVQPGYSGALIEDVEIDGMGSASLDSGISGGGWTARRVDIHGMSDGVKLDSNVKLEDSYIHDLWTTAPAPHSDGAQSMGWGQHHCATQHDSHAGRVRAERRDLPRD